MIIIAFIYCNGLNDSLSLSLLPVSLSLPLLSSFFSLSILPSAQGDASDSDGAKKRKKKYRLEVHHQQSFVGSADDVRPP